MSLDEVVGESEYTEEELDFVKIAEVLTRQDFPTPIEDPIEYMKPFFEVAAKFRTDVEVYRPEGRFWHRKEVYVAGDKKLIATFQLRVYSETPHIMQYDLKEWKESKKKLGGKIPTPFLAVEFQGPGQHYGMHLTPGDGSWVPVQMFAGGKKIPLIPEIDSMDRLYSGNGLTICKKGIQSFAEHFLEGEDWKRDFLHRGGLSFDEDPEEGIATEDDELNPEVVQPTSLNLFPEEDWKDPIEYMKPFFEVASKFRTDVDVYQPDGRFWHRKETYSLGDKTLAITVNLSHWNNIPKAIMQYNLSKWNETKEKWRRKRPKASLILELTEGENSYALKLTDGENSYGVEMRRRNVWHGFRVRDYDRETSKNIYKPLPPGVEEDILSKNSSGELSVSKAGTTKGIQFLVEKFLEGEEYEIGEAVGTQVETSFDPLRYLLDALGKPDLFFEYGANKSHWSISYDRPTKEYQYKKLAIDLEASKKLPTDPKLKDIASVTWSEMEQKYGALKLECKVHGAEGNSSLGITKEGEEFVFDPVQTTLHYGRRDLKESLDLLVKHHLKEEVPTPLPLQNCDTPIDEGDPIAFMHALAEKMGFALGFKTESPGRLYTSLYFAQLQPQFGGNFLSIHSPRTKDFKEIRKRLEGKNIKSLDVLGRDQYELRLDLHYVKGLQWGRIQLNFNNFDGKFRFSDYSLKDSDGIGEKEAFVGLGFDTIHTDDFRPYIHRFFERRLGLSDHDPDMYVNNPLQVVEEEVEEMPSIIDQIKAQKWKDPIEYMKPFFEAAERFRKDVEVVYEPDSGPRNVWTRKEIYVAGDKKLVATLEITQSGNIPKVMGYDLKDWKETKKKWGRRSPGKDFKLEFTSKKESYGIDMDHYWGWYGRALSTAYDEEKKKDVYAPLPPHDKEDTIDRAPQTRYGFAINDKGCRKGIQFLVEKFLEGEEYELGGEAHLEGYVEGYDNADIEAPGDVNYQGDIGSLADFIKKRTPPETKDPLVYVNEILGQLTRFQEGQAKWEKGELADVWLYQQYKLGPRCIDLSVLVDHFDVGDKDILKQVKDLQLGSFSCEDIEQLIPGSTVSLGMYMCDEERGDDNSLDYFGIRSAKRRKRLEWTETGKDHAKARAKNKNSWKKNLDYYLHWFVEGLESADRDEVEEETTVEQEPYKVNPRTRDPLKALHPFMEEYKGWLVAEESVHVLREQTSINSAMYQSPQGKKLGVTLSVDLDPNDEGGFVYVLPMQTFDMSTQGVSDLPNEWKPHATLEMQITEAGEKDPSQELTMKRDGRVYVVLKKSGERFPDFSFDGYIEEMVNYFIGSHSPEQISAHNVAMDGERKKYAEGQKEEFHTNSCSCLLSICNYSLSNSNICLECWISYHIINCCTGCNTNQRPNIPLSPLCKVSN